MATRTPTLRPDMNLLSFLFFLFFVAFGLVLFLIALRIGAAVTRGAVGLTNACCGGRDVTEHDFLRGGGHQYDPIPRPKSLAGIRIPVPAVGYAILVNFLTGLVGWVVATGVLVGGVVMAVSYETLLDSLPEVGEPLPPAWVTVMLIYWCGAVPAGLLANAVVLKMALPTTLFRGVVVTFWQVVLGCVLPFVVLAGVGYALHAGGAVEVPVAKPAAVKKGWF